jgi:hypothetical protein
MLSSTELHERFAARLDLLRKSMQCEVQTIEWLQEIYNEPWFVANCDKYLIADDSISFQCPKGLVTLLTNKTYELVDSYILAIDQIIERIGTPNERDKKRLKDWHISFETYFELRTLDLLVKSGFSVLERDSTTARRKEVEAIVTIDNLNAHIECKVLNNSEPTRAHTFYASLFQRYTITARVKLKKCLVGDIEFDKDVSYEDWQKIFEAANLALNSGKTIKILGDSYRGDMAFIPFADLENSEKGTFQLVYKFPVNSRIKSTLNKALGKLKSLDQCVVFICVPRESGHKGAYDETVKLLQNRKYRKITTVFLVDPKDTFEDEYINVLTIQNPYSDRFRLRWDDTRRVIIRENPSVTN